MPGKKDTSLAPPRLVFVTGPSGAGRSTAIKALEDVGFEVIDNLPLRMVERLFASEPLDHSLALGLDVRNRDFSPEALLEQLDLLATGAGISPELLYLDCQAHVLLRRYSETRRRHPLAQDEGPAEGIRREMDLLDIVRERADVLIDTSEMTPHGLRTQIETWFAPREGHGLTIGVQSFSYKRGLPQGLDMVIDCRFLRNPHWEAGLRAMTGMDAPVAAYIEGDERFTPFFDRLSDLIGMLLPAYMAEGRAHFTIGFGCTGGQHRSVFVAERVSKALASGGWQVSIRHREMDRRSGSRRLAALATDSKETDA